MAVARLGTYTLHQQSSNGSIALNVPADASACVVIVTGYPGNSDIPMFSTLNWDGAGLDFELIRTQYWAPSNAQIGAYCMTSASAGWPGGGAKTLYYTAPGYSEGYNILVLFYDGVDAANPIVGSDGSNNIASNWSSNISGVGAADMGIVAAYNWVASGTTVNSNGQTQIVNTALFNYSILAAGEKAATGALTVGRTSGDIIPLAIVLRAAATGGSTSVTISDTAHGSDAITGLLVRLSIVDSAAGVDGFGSRAAAVPVADSAIGSDIIANIRAAFIVADVSTAADAITISVHVPVADAGTAADVLSILTALLKVVADSGTGTDAVQVGVAPLLVADAATGLDLLQISAAVSIADLGTGIDALAILQALLKVVTDAATGTDGIGGISVAVPVSDAGHGLDLIGALTVAARVVDLAHGFDAVVRITGEGPNKRIVITFSAKKPSIAFGPGKTPGITFH